MGCKKDKKRKHKRQVVSLASPPWLLAVEIGGGTYDTMEPTDGAVADLRAFEASVKPGLVDVARLRQVVMSFFMDRDAERAVMASGESDLLAIYAAASTYYECRLAARLARAARGAAEAAAGGKLAMAAAPRSPAVHSPPPNTMVTTGGLELLAGHTIPAAPSDAKQ